jgi:hypothetical protein
LGPQIAVGAAIEADPVEMRLYDLCVSAVSSLTRRSYMASILCTCEPHDGHNFTT